MVYTGMLVLVSQHITQIRRVDSRHTIYLQKTLVDDSAFPFKAGEPLMVRIDGKRLIIEKVST